MPSNRKYNDADKVAEQALASLKQSFFVAKPERIITRKTLALLGVLLGLGIAVALVSNPSGKFSMSNAASVNCGTNNTGACTVNFSTPGVHFVSVVGKSGSKTSRATAVVIVGDPGLQSPGVPAPPTDAPCREPFDGEHDRVGVDTIRGQTHDQWDTRFLCSNSRWFMCSPDDGQNHGWAIDSADGQHVSSWICERQNSLWITEDPALGACNTAGYRGTHNVVGLQNGTGDRRFLCYSSVWLGCGWDHPPDVKTDWMRPAYDKQQAGNYRCDLPRTRWVSVSATAAIQGTFVKYPGNAIATPPTGLVVTLDGVTPQTATPNYLFNGIAPGNHTVSVSVPTGWGVGYTLCYDSDNTCHDKTPTQGNSVTIDVPAEGVANLWWHFMEPPLTLSCQPKPLSVTPGGSLTWTATASGGSGTYSFSWADTIGNQGPTGGSNPNSFGPLTYNPPPGTTQIGATVIVLDSNNQKKEASCQASVNPPLTGTPSCSLVISAPPTKPSSFTATFSSVNAVACGYSANGGAPMGFDCSFSVPFHGNTIPLGEYAINAGVANSVNQKAYCPATLSVPCHFTISPSQGNAGTTFTASLESLPDMKDCTWTANGTTPKSVDCNFSTTFTGAGIPVGTYDIVFAGSNAQKQPKSCSTSFTITP